MSDYGLVRNGDNDIWVGYSGQTGAVLGEVRKVGDSFQVYIASGYSKSGNIPQGSPHRTLKDAAEDLYAFYR